MAGSAALLVRWPPSACLPSRTMRPGDRQRCRSVGAVWPAPLCCWHNFPRSATIPGGGWRCCAIDALRPVALCYQGGMPRAMPPGTGRIGSRGQLAENVGLVPVPLGCSGGAQRHCGLVNVGLQRWFDGKPELRKIGHGRAGARGGGGVLALRFVSESPMPAMGSCTWGRAGGHARHTILASDEQSPSGTYTPVRACLWALAVGAAAKKGSPGRARDAEQRTKRQGRRGARAHLGFFLPIGQNEANRHRPGILPWHLHALALSSRSGQGKTHRPTPHTRRAGN